MKSFLIVLVADFLVGSLPIVCFAVPGAAAGDFWAKKPYQNWSADETRSMLEESPWATTFKLSGVQSGVTGGDAPTDRGYRGEMETDPFITYNLQFRSALPIRQAQVRSSQLSSHYDKMSAEQKAAFDASAAKFLAVTFPDRVIVSVTFHTNVQDYDSSLRNYWASQSLAKLSMSVYPEHQDREAEPDRLQLQGRHFSVHLSASEAVSAG